MDDKDDILQHYGKLGMKWGRRKLANHPIDRAIKALTKQRKPKWENNPVDKAAKFVGNKHNAKMVKVADKYHEKNKGKRLYNALYNKNLKKYDGKHNDPHTKAVLRTRKQIANTKAAIAVASMVAAKTVYSKAVTPANIKAGKNLILAMKRSPIRYADAAKFKDAINI